MACRAAGAQAGAQRCKTPRIIGTGRHAYRKAVTVARLPAVSAEVLPVERSLPAGCQSHTTPSQQRNCPRGTSVPAGRREAHQSSGVGGGPRARRGACWWGCRRRGWPSPRRAWAQERVSIARVRSVAPRGCAARCARARRARQRLAPGARLVGDAGEAHHGQGRDRQRDLVQPAHAEPHAAARPDDGSVWVWGGVATRHSGGATRAPAVPRRCASHAAPRPPPHPVLRSVHTYWAAILAR